MKWRTFAAGIVVGMILDTVLGLAAMKRWGPIE